MSYNSNTSRRNKQLKKQRKSLEKRRKLTVSTTTPMPVSTVPSSPPPLSPTSVIDLDVSAPSSTSSSCVSLENDHIVMSQLTQTVTEMAFPSFETSIKPPFLSNPFSLSKTPSPSSIAPDTTTSIIVRKKSGERVKSSLKLPSLVRHKSLPAPSKMVHFDTNLEHVRHFLHSERPAAVSANSTSADERAEFHWATDSEGSSSEDEEEDNLRSGFQRYMSRSEWSISLPNFPHLLIDQMKAKNVFFESLFLSSDKSSLVGHVAVRNMDFQKSVCVRYTLDDWKTFTEVQADYNDDSRTKCRLDGYDKFTFAIRIASLPYLTLSTKPIFMCVRYLTAGQEFWDNNNSNNYRVDFSRVPKAKEPSSDSGMFNENTGRLRTRRAHSFGSDMPIFKNFSFDTKSRNNGSSSQKSLASKANGSFSQSTSKDSEANIKFDSEFNHDFDHFNSHSNNTSVEELFEDLAAPKLKTKEPKNQFNSRYSFGESFRASKTSFGREFNKVKSSYSMNHKTLSSPFSPSALPTDSTPHRQHPIDSASETSRTRLAPTSTTNHHHHNTNNSSTSPALDSMSYQELIQKYCFFQGTSPSKNTSNNKVLLPGFNAQEVVV